MSKLSALLNPAPSSGSETSPMTNHTPQVQPLVLDGRNHRASISYSGSPTHTRHPSITSPGLEALANVASNTAPIPSPTQHTGSFAQSIPFQPSYTQYGSRPSSSQTALPPLPSEYHGHHISSHTSTLEQYHHPSGSERRLSNAADSSARLPPLQHSPTDQHFTSFSDSHQPLNGITDYANGIIPEKPVYATSSTRQGFLGNGAEQTIDIPITSQFSQSSPETSKTILSTAYTESQGQQVEVKAEIAENLAEMPKYERRPSGQAVETLGKSMGSPAPKNLMDIKKDAQSPMAADNASAPSSKPKGPPSKKRAAPKKGTASAVRPAVKKRKLDNDSVDGTPSVQRSGTPATSRASNTPVPKNRKQGSITPARSSSVVNGPDDDDGSEEDTEAYCICRKPDDHTLMIGCDGPCEDWFHVRCVSMDSVKAKLISKWYCEFQLCVLTISGTPFY